MSTLAGERIVVAGAGGGLAPVVIRHLRALHADVVLTDPDLGSELPTRVDTLVYFVDSSSLPSVVWERLADVVWPRMAGKGGTIVLAVGSPEPDPASLDGWARLAEELSGRGRSLDVMSVVVTTGGPVEADAFDHETLARAFSYLAIRPMHYAGRIVTARELSRESDAWDPVTSTQDR